jgi:replicative DNA helicase
LRVPPHSLEAERSLLGALLLDTEAFEEVSALITPEDFYKEPHRHIYRSMEQVAGRNEAIDVVTLVQQLRDEGRLDAVGGLSYIAGLSSAVPTAANVAFYAGLVRKKSLLRRVISVSAEISEECYGDVGDVEGFINSAEARLMELSSSKSNSAVRSLKDVVKEAYYQIESLYERDETITGVPSGFVDLDNKTAGWQSSDLIIVAARPAMGKCVSADAEILLDSGEVVTMEELMRRRSATLLTLRDDWRFEPRSPSAYVDDGHKPLFEVTTRLGRRLKVTWTHPLLTPNGWRPLGTLSVGERIAVPRVLPIFGSHQPRRAEAILLGYLLGDGTLTGATPRFTQQDPRLQRDFEGSVSEFPEWIQAFGRIGRDAHQSFVPPEIFRWEREALSLFLNRLFATDGWVTRLDSGQVQVGYATVSERLARQVQHLLLRFGVIAQLRQRRVTDRDERREIWQIDITLAESLRSFTININIFTKEEELRSLLDEVEPVSTQNAPLQALAQSQVYWDEIVSITPCGEGQVYDLTIPETHNFIANDICVHNTAFTLNMASNAAVRFGKVVLFCSLEMSAPQLAMRLMASEARVDVSRLRVGALKESEWGRLIQATATLSKAPIFIDDSAGLTTQMLTSRARRLKVEHGLDMIIIDYLQLIGSARPVASREQHISEVSRTLKMLAKEMHIPVIALAQLNRGVESRADKRPMLSDLRESGAIEQDADIISFVYRDEYYNPDSEQKGIAEVILGKHRSGSTGTVELRFFPEFTRFENLARAEDDQ